MAPGESEFVVVNNTLGQRVSLAARDSATALSRALRNNPSWDSYQHQIRILSATPQAQEETSREFYVGNNRLGGTVRVEAPDEAEALHAATRARPEWSIRDLTATEVGGASNQSNNEPAPNQDSEGEYYLVSDPGDNSGGVRFRANSPEHAIERARAAFNLPADRELQARLENG